MQDEIKFLKEEHDSMQSKLDQCESGNQDAIMTQNELVSCRDELTNEHNLKQQIYQKLQSAKQKVKILEDDNKRHSQSLQSAERNIETLKDDKKVLQNQLNSEKTESERLRDRIRKLENENQGLHKQNQNIQNSIDSCQETGKITFKRLSVSSDLMKSNFVTTISSYHLCTIHRPI